LSILWFGIGDTQNEFIIFLAAFFPMLLNTVSGVQGVDTNLIRAAESHGANRWNVFWTVVLRGALPTIFVGARIGLGIGWMALVAAELVAATSGLGFLINNARNVFRTDHVVLGMAVIGILGLAMDFALRRLARLLMPWHPASR
jgi:ABC-type nitrate/sulfonate/bicarbonate transport system permease component